MPTKPTPIHADVTIHRGPLGYVVIAKVTAPGERTVNSTLYRIAAELEAQLDCGPDTYRVEVVTHGTPNVRGVRLVLPETDTAQDAAYAEELVIDACVACGLEPEHAGSGPLDR